MKRVMLALLVIFSLFSFLPAFSLRTLSENYEMVLNIPAKKVIIYSRNQAVKEYPVGVGKSLTPTPLGKFKIVRRIYNPAWVNPYRQSKVIAPGETNPIGQYWLGFAMNKKSQEYGFHATADLNSVGQASTHGCIRMNPSDMKELFNLVKIGTIVHVIYNPVEVKEFENRLFIRAYPDIYNYMSEEEYLQFAKNQLSGANLVQEQNLYKAIANKDGKDYFIGWTGAEKLNEQEQGPVEKGKLN
ncbi:MAG: L,D-transpeptidase [Candidatus Melainabacteria bacterium]|nr:L,D-transpeptidase [Candidatus Melainabacteria bacterium]